MHISDVAALALDRAKTLSLFERTEPKIVLSSSGDAARLAPAANSLVPICQRLRPAKNDSMACKKSNGHEMRNCR
jgi:hypothetical protein